MPPSAQRTGRGHARPQHLTSAALDYARRGWRVFPVRPDAKKPPALHSQAACPGRGPCASGHRKWEDRATTDPDRIAAAWAHAPYGVGIACGPSGLVVIDLDVPAPGEQPPPGWALPGVRDGADVLAVLAERAGAAIDFDTFTVATPRGGMHLYYTAPPGTRIGNRAGERGAGLGWKVDVRGWGGYVLAPPSTNTGRPYRLTHDTAPVPLPEWLTGLLTPAPPAPPPLECPPATADPIADLPAYARTALQGEGQRVAGARTGGRNHALNKAAYNLGRLVGAGLLTADHAADHLTQAAAVHLGTGGLTPAEIRTTIASGLTAGTRNPRTITRGNPA
ncbi:bifunctional DNA primase/polymerase [Actinomadura graeca]|uniref:Bifunctional DNA primase/polymerase n=1 Tax=Actinomadura graeca TaxID=2750812 RepID=A0ABX8QUU4_9ACTN|nr:bifunctional DNA primase/polymerase [Actinomadura graeca]QXJ22515.1 bifunctional DNA primase/polymerase [Actinomadura graeca]